MLFSYRFVPVWFGSFLCIFNVVIDLFLLYRSVVYGFNCVRALIDRVMSREM